MPASKSTSAQVVVVGVGGLYEQVSFLRIPKDEEGRALVAGACVRKLGIQIPAVIDAPGNSTEQAYTGWPDRLT